MTSKYWKKSMEIMIKINFGLSLCIKDLWYTGQSYVLLGAETIVSNPIPSPLIVISNPGAMSMYSEVHG